MSPVSRLSFPEPPEPPRERFWQRFRRRSRRKLLRLFDRTILLLWNLISWLDKWAPVERRYYRVAIFGSSRIRTEGPAYARVKELARRLSFMGCDIVTGGGPGLMMAANEGARSGAYRRKTRSFGLTILLPLEEQPNPFLDEVAEHRTFFSRLHQFIRLSHAYVVVEGGLGTTLEALMVWQLIQVGILHRRPLIFVGGMWLGLRNWVGDALVKRGFASSEDLDQVHWVEDIEDALAIVNADRQQFLARQEVILPPDMEEEEKAGPPSS